MEDTQWTVASLAFTIWMSQVIAAIILTTYIGYHDINKKWEPFRLNPSMGKFSSSEIKRKYFTSFLHTIPNRFIMFPAFLYLFCYHQFDNLTKPMSLYEYGKQFVLAVISHQLFDLWNSGVHYVLHAVPFFYKTFHKKHHVPLTEFTPFTGAVVTNWDFFFIEIIGTFVPGLVFGFHIHIMILIAIVLELDVIQEHSGFRKAIPYMDGSYHWEHHVNPGVNIHPLFDYLKMNPHSKVE